MRRTICATRFRHIVLACAVISWLDISSCSDLDEITQFAKAAQDVGKAFPGMAADAQASCGRANSFINAQNQVPPLPCGVYPALNPLLIKVNDALFNYIASLGKLASADLSKVSGGFDSLGADLKQADPNISTTDQTKASAASGLAKAITNLLANGYRQRELSKIIQANDKAVQDVVEFLSQYAAGKYQQSFADEWRYEESFCENMKSNTEPLATDLLNRKCTAEKAAIDQQEKAVKDYQGALATIATTHAKLAKEGQHWDAKQLSKDLSPDIVSLGNAAVTVNKAFLRR